MLEPEKEERPTIPEPAKCTNAMYDRMVAALTSSPEKDFIVQQTGKEWRPRTKLEKWVAEGKASP